MEVGLQADVTCHLVKGWHLKVPLRKKGKRTAETIVFAGKIFLGILQPLNRL